MKEEMHSTSVHLDMILKGLILSAHSGQPKTMACAESNLGWSECGHCGKSKITQNALMASQGYLSFDVLSTAMIPGNWRKIISDAGSVGYEPGSEF
jgi:hypothetical protein